VADIVLDLALVALGVGVLYYGADWLVRGSARLAASLGVPPIVVGLTVVSLGTSAPELVVCILAATGGNPGLAIGNVLGSNLANIGLILGLTSVIRPLEVHSRVVWREAPLMLLITVALLPLLWDLELSRGDGVLLLIALTAYLSFVFMSAGDERPEILGEYEEFMEASTGKGTAIYPPDVFWVVAGSACLVLGGYCIVEGAVQVASKLGVSDVAIGLSVVAIGTSLPELATSLMAAARKEADIAVGNVIGSNIFNVAAILGVTSLMEPFTVPESVLTHHLPGVIFITVLLLPLLRTQWKIRRWEGALLIAAYVGVAVFVL
jgi:cation:H+ antiporter